MAAAIVMGVCVAEPVTAQAITAAEVTRKVNVAGRQRMLSQRMAKASCLMAAEIDAGTHFTQLTQAYDLFQRSNAALRVGDESMGLGPEQRQAVLRSLQAIDTPWIGYSNIVADVIDAGTAEAGRMETMSEASVSVLTLMNRAVNQTARSYGSVLPDVPMALTITIDVAGRQRMLTQKAMKETCLLYVTGDPAYARALAGTVGLFDLSLSALQDGFEDVGVMAAPSPMIAGQLGLVRDLWEPMKVEFLTAASEERIPEEALMGLAARSDVLLFEMNKAVGMYELPLGDVEG